MIQPRLFLCNGISSTDYNLPHEGYRLVELDSNHESHNLNVFIQLENLTKVFQKHLSPRLTDLLEIAAYIYTGDCATPRGTQWTDQDSTEAWEREFRFVIPVRDPNFWSKDEVKKLLLQLLSFLSNDKYSFEFPELTQRRSKQLYLQFSDREDWPFYGVDRILMFSGGLDSLAGAVETASKDEKLVLVSHRSSAVMDKRQRQLFDKYTEPQKLDHRLRWIVV
ncbi:MAG: hypothetical protein L0346_08380 [Chloroflexi bacterium]|nr:hypothetical protein [Chloroflexota bacterium]